MNYDKVNAERYIFDFESFIPCDENPVPNNRIMDFLTVGPFVLETKGSFEAEHMYEREKILYEDYLLPDGGECSIIPEEGKKVTNKYYGKDFYRWERGFIKWNSLRFDRDEDACDPALYATEQRNAVYYAAFYIKCKTAKKAIIGYENSGCSLFVNGELADFKPFGRVKGLNGFGYQCLVQLKKGVNLILFKLRGGYIADTMDISMPACVVYPVCAEADGLCLSSPIPTNAFFKSPEAPRNVFHIFASAQRDIESGIIECDGEKLDIPALKKGETAAVQIGIESSDKYEIRKCILKLACGSEKCEKYFYFGTRASDGYDGNEHIMSDFHFDTTYHQEQRTYALGAFHITKSIIEKLDENPDFKAVLSEIDYLHPYYTLYPHHRKSLKEAFISGRAEADCFYNQPNDLTSSGEAFVRNLVYGQLYHRDVLGRISRVYAPGDVFGHFSQITQVCKKGGCDMVRWGKCVLGLDNLFRHISPDGTTLLHDKGIGRGDALRLGVKGCSHSSAALDYMEAFPRSGDTSFMKKTVSHAKFSVFSELADDINASDKENAASGKNSAIDLTSRDLTQHHSGVLLTRTDFKQANRLCENLLTSAEKFAAIAFLYGAKYPEKALDKAWRQLLCAQHHDSVTGTNNEISFVDLMIEYREAAFLANDILTRAASYIASLVETEKRENALFVFNPACRETGGVCRIDLKEGYTAQYSFVTDTEGKKHAVYEDGKGAYFIADRIPSAGYALYRLEKTDKAFTAIRKGSDPTIQNRRFTLTVDKSHGGIISIFDKKEKRECIDSSAPSSANTVYALHEIHDRMETQHELYTDGKKAFTDEYEATITSEKCADFEKLTVVSPLGTLARIIREITLYKNSDVIDFRTVIEDYNSEDDMFCAAFPMNIKGGAVIFDDRFAPHISTRSKKYMSFQTHQYASFSGCRVLPANRWFGIGPSVTFKLGSGEINLGMTALIRKDEPGTVAASEKLLTALSKKAVPVTPYPDTEQHGGHKIIHFNEDIYETDTRIVLTCSGDGNLYADKLIKGFKKSINAEIRKALKDKGIAVIYTQDSENIYNKPVDVLLVIAADNEKLNIFAEEISNKLAKGYIADINCIEASPVPESERYGAEIINNGNIACSVEKNTLNLMLFHTAAFYGNQGKVTGSKELVPEKKTHIFTYQLCLHKNSFREADVYGKAAVFNEGLFSVMQPEQRAEAFLPQTKSFIKTQPGFEITAVKAGGYPYAALKDETESPVDRGICVRGYECSGTDKTFTVKTGFEIAKAQSADLLEENRKNIRHGENTFTVKAGAHSIETVILTPVKAYDYNGQLLGAEKESVEPTYVRSWEHDMGSVPMGYLKFAATLDKKRIQQDDTHLTVNLNAVNNSTETEAKVKISFKASNGLKTDKKSVTVKLQPGESSVTPLSVTKAGADTEGQIKIFYEYDGQQFTDVYEIGYFNPDVELKIDGEKIICTVKNTSAQQLDGSLYIASPFETWGDLTGNKNAFGNISPLAYTVELKPYETKLYEFRAEFGSGEFFKAYYAAVKLCSNGRIHFAFADCHGPRHNVWAHEFIKEIYEDNGSIEKLLKM